MNEDDPNDYYRLQPANAGKKKIKSILCLSFEILQEEEKN